MPSIQTLVFSALLVIATSASAALDLRPDTTLQAPPARRSLDTNSYIPDLPDFPLPDDLPADDECSPDAFCPRQDRSGVLLSGEQTLNASGKRICHYGENKCKYSQTTNHLTVGSDICADVLETVTYTCPKRDGLTLRNFNLKDNVMECSAGAETCFYSTVTGLLINGKLHLNTPDHCLSQAPTCRTPPVYRHRRWDNLAAVIQKQEHRRRMAQLRANGSAH